MAKSNRDRINEMFEILSPALQGFLEAHLGDRWVDELAAKDARNGSAARAYSPTDPQSQLRTITEFGYQLRGVLSRPQTAYATELREVRNQWAHHGSFTADDAYRALDTAERLLLAVGAPREAARVQGSRNELRRLSAETTDRKVLAHSAQVPAAAGLRPWREVLRPHDDVASGRFQSSEFAADLFRVATGQSQSSDYADPVEFFARTYLTEGLRDLIDRTVRRLAGDTNASPVINLQTNFGGGKTHSMLSLWHLAAGEPLTSFPQEVQEVLDRAGYQNLGPVRRVAIVGNHISVNGEQRPGGVQVSTLWGELAWQLGGAEAYALVTDADRTGTAPGQVLHELLHRYAPAVILIDEWVAYARQLYDRTDLAGGTFDTQFTFAQSLTEAVKTTPGVMLAISIPASYDDASGAGSAEEVGGSHGLEALSRLQNVVRRVADQWRPASSNESYRIVRQRLFQEPDAAALAAIHATARGFVDFYRQQTGDFPKEAQSPAYEERIRQTYPIHPELFDRLYEDWSGLERFQRTRGVLRLMNAVIFALWQGADQSALILPASVPLHVDRVNSELTQYLPDSWKAVIDADVDGPGSEPWRIDESKPLLGQRSVTKRLARAVFFGATPTLGGSHKGLDTQRVFLGTAAPGDVTGHFHQALTNLGDRATYFYSASGRHWYDLHANITRRAKDQAERLHPEDVWAEIVRRLTAQQKDRDAFARVHVCPETSADIPDLDEARLVVIHPRFSHVRNATDSSAVAFATEATSHQGSRQRANRNMLVYLAADQSAMADLDTAVRDYLGWSSVLENAAELDLTGNQQQQATDRRAQADRTVLDRLALTYHWVLVPEQPEASEPISLACYRADAGSDLSLAARVARKLRNEDLLRTQHAAAAIRSSLNTYPRLWESGHISVGALWELYARYPYLHRLRDLGVLLDGCTHQPLLWDRDGFAMADSVDSSGRYQGLTLPDDPHAPPVTTQTLIVKPSLAVAQRTAETAVAPPAGSSDFELEPAPAADSPEPQAPAERPRPHHYFGVKTLSAGRYALDFKAVNDEVLAHLSAAGTEVKVTLEIHAESASGFDETTARTLSENSQTLRFDQSSLE
ncbi:MAG: Swt1 family HEPN domain-containing protein [Actinomycetia bacterium]|nr:Swt1 family HEPN domain-containing protein [Actinomycetes bacterium]